LPVYTPATSEAFASKKNFFFQFIQFLFIAYGDISEKTVVLQPITPPSGKKKKKKFYF
jgi:hypothetical protein